MTMGAGRVIYQNLPRIALSIQDGSFYKNPAFLSAMTQVKNAGGKLHLMGLVGAGSVHSSKDQLSALLRMAQEQGLEKVFVHAFTDGRDSPPTSGLQHIRDLEREMNMIGVGRIASVIGRNWAMDRNNNWDRIEKAYLMLTEGKGEPITDVSLYLEQSYLKNTTDEYIEPGVIVDSDSKPIAIVEAKDAVIYFNYREDRARELTKAFTLPGFEKFNRPSLLDIQFVTMTEYERDLPVTHIAFPPETVENSLGEVLANANKKQLRIAETEKYAHVTYFFNGGKERAFPGEDRILIPSPTVSKFDQTPEMSSSEVTDTVIKAIEEGQYDFILVNYANPDMVAHTGNEAATIEAVAGLAVGVDAPAELWVGGSLHRR